MLCIAYDLNNCSLPFTRNTPMHSSRLRHTPRHDITSSRSYRSTYSDDSSLYHTPRPRSASPGPSRLPLGERHISERHVSREPSRVPGERRIRDLHEALDDAENRRNVLRDKLRDAQDTIQVCSLACEPIGKPQKLSSVYDRS